MTVVARARDSGASAAAGEAGQLREAMAALLDRVTSTAPGTLVSATIPVSRPDPVAIWDAARSGGDAPSLWLRPDDGLALVALGEAWRVRASGAGRFDEVADAWSALQGGVVDGPGVRGTGPVLIGGFGFAAAPSVSDLWRGFEAADLILPRLLLTVRGDSTWLTTSLLATGRDEADETVDEMTKTWASICARASAAGDAPDTDPPTDGDAPTASEPPAAGDVLRITAQRPTAPEWRATVARFAGAVGRGRLDKVVLARQIDVLAPAPIDVAQVLRRLRASAPESTVFAVTRGERTFLGASPERLVRLEGRDLRSVAMAGSIRRGSDAEGDAMLAEELLHSDKEREEHEVVVRMLRETLAPLCEALDIAADPEVVTLRHVQHLVTEVSGRLARPAGIIELVGRLHPTPAVGGAPRDLALELIEEDEPHERGWYAGPVGWLDGAGAGEFIVALRSGVIDSDTATLFAGCGIVADSDPDREWDESLVKLRALGSALGRIEP